MEPEKENLPPQQNNSIKSLRTYQGDIDEIMSKGKASMATIVIAEQKKKTLLPNYEQEQTKTVVRNKSFVFIGISLGFLGLVIIGMVYYFIESKNQVFVEQKTKALLSYSQERVMPVASSSRESIVQIIVKENANLNLPVNSILYLNTADANKNALDISNVLGKIAPRMPASLVRSFGEKYMLGIYSFDENQPFIILSVNSFPESYAGMLQWEKDMVSDIGGIFGITGSLGTTTPTFADEALRNKDLRVIKNAGRKTVLLYSFVDSKTLIITGSENVFEGLLGKYLISQNVK